MKADLYLENQQLRLQLKELVSRARKNEQKFQRLNAFELRLIGCTSLHELIQRVVHEYRSYGGADFATLAIVDPLYEAQRTLRDHGIEAKDEPNVIFYSSDDYLNRLFNISVAPKLGLYKPQLHGELFPNVVRPPESIALLPLIRHGELIGSLNLGSVRVEHFTRNPSTEFLERLAAIVAMCLENSTNLERIKSVGLTDALTGVKNRRFFDQRLQEEISRAVRHGGELTCLLLDLDRFKQVNDTYGHPSGDRVLIEAAEIMRSQLRGTDVLARYGGEEFAALLIQSDLRRALEIAERIRAAIAQHKFKAGDQTPLEITVSIGAATLEHRPEELSQSCSRLLGNADQALYAAKDGGRNRVVPYEGAPERAM
jgi:diguanylate cyclase (GGDEF)-like protein